MKISGVMQTNEIGQKATESHFNALVPAGVT